MGSCRHCPACSLREHSGGKRPWHHQRQDDAPCACGGLGGGGRERIIPTSWLGAGRGRAPHLHTAGRPNSVSSSRAQHTGPSLLSTPSCLLAPIFPPGQGGLLRLHEGPWESAQETQALRMPRSGPLRPSTDTCLPTSTWPAPTGDLRTSAPAFLPPAPPPPQPFSLCPGC